MSNIRDFIDLYPLYDLVTGWKMANEHVRSAEEELDGAESNMLEADPETAHEAEHSYHAAQAYLEGCEDELHQAIEAVFSYLETAQRPAAWNAVFGNAD